jgi:hypothetical protein
LECVSQELADPTSGMQKRMEAHVDFRFTAVQVVDAPKADTEGGRLVIANDTQARSVEEINKNATYISHRLGTLVCFSQGGNYAHYTEEITGGRRIVIAHNYKKASETAEETARLTANILTSREV